MTNLSFVSGDCGDIGVCCCMFYTTMTKDTFSRLTTNLPSTNSSASVTTGPLLSVVSMGCVMAFAIFGNILVLLAVYRTKSLRTTAAILVVNLAFVDLSITLAVVPFVMTTAVTQEWGLSWRMCKLTGFINAFLTAGQIMALLHISINRYIAVVYPHSYETRCNKRGTISAVLLTWLYSLLWTSLPFFGWGKLGFIRGTLFCNILWSEEMAYAITVQVMCYFIPGILGAILYLNVYRRVRKQGKRVFERTFSLELEERGSSSSKESNSSNMPASPGLSFDNLAVSRDDISELGFTDLKNTMTSTAARRTRRRKAMEARVTKTLLAVIMAFVICWFPRGVANLWAIFATREDVPRALEYSSTVFAFSNAAVNPVLYGALHQDFKRAFKQIICCEPAKVKGNRSRAVTNGSASLG